MMTQIRAFFAPPQFPDSLENRRASYLNYTLWSLIVMLGLLLITRLLTDRQTFSVTNLILTSIIAISLGLQWVLRQGYIRLSSFILIACGWLGLAYLAWDADGVRDMSFNAFIIVIMIASLLLGWRVGGGIVILSVLMGWFLAYAELNGILETTLDTPYGVALDATVIFSLIALLLQLIITNLQTALQQAIKTNQELQQLSTDLEKRVSYRTRDLALAAEIGQTITRIQTLDQLLTQTVEQIQTTFGLYHTQIYLTDSSGQVLLLQAATGTVGKQLLRLGHTLPVDQHSPNGRAALERHPILTPNTLENRTFQTNPFLPLTRSQLTMPLLVGERTVGVLDLQSNQPNALTADNLPAFLALAGQLAIAIDNNALFSEREQALAGLSLEQNRIQSILEAFTTPTIISRVNDGLVLYLNEPLAEIIGVTRESLIGRSTPDFYVNSTDRDALLLAISQHGGVDNYELNLKRFDGRRFWAQASARRINYQDTPAIMTSLVDITERKLAQLSILKRATELETAARVSAAAATILDPQKLLQEVVDLTKTNFDLYHVHIYLLQKDKEVLTLAAGAGEVGREMVRQGHTIPLQQAQSLVARSARTREGIIVNDAHQVTDFLPNPLLPLTQAEMAIPMIVGEQVLGVLDVQAKQVDHFTAEDVRIQTTLAAQVAVALQNAQLYAQMQASLSATEETRLRYALAVTGSNDGIWDWNLSTNEIYYSRRWKEMIGYTDTEIGHSFTELSSRLHPEDQDRVLIAVTDYLEGRNPTYEIEFRLQHKDGSYRWILARATAVHDENGRPYRMAGSHTDITARKQSEETLRQSQNQLLEAMRSARLAYLELDMSRQTLTLSDPFYEYIVASNATAEGGYEFSIWDIFPRFVHPDDQKMALSIFQEMMQSSATENEEIVVRMVGRDGRTRHISTRLSLSREHQDSTTKLLLITQDITEAKQAEADQLRLTAELEQRLQQVNALQRTMSREGWQTFLTAQDRPIQGYRFHQDTLRLISRQDTTHPDLLSVNQAAALFAPESNNTTAASPMQLHGESIGILGVRQPTGTPLPAETQSLLTEISQQVAAALERARLSEQTQTALAEAETLSRLSAKLNAAQSYQAINDALTEILMSRFREAPLGILFEVECNSQGKPEWLNIVASNDEMTRNSPYQRILLAMLNPSPIWVEQSRTPTIITHIETDSRLNNQEQMLYKQNNLATIVFLPLRLGERWLGLVNLAWRHPLSFTPMDERLLTAIVDQLALAVNSIQLLKAAQQRAEQEQLLREIATRVSAAIDAESLLRTAAEEIGRALKMETFVILDSTTGNGRYEPTPTEQQG